MLCSKGKPDRCEQLSKADPEKVPFLMLVLECILSSVRVEKG